MNNELGKRKLLAAGSADAPRTYPPTQLEWTANKRSIPMALQAEFFDSKKKRRNYFLFKFCLIHLIRFSNYW